MTDKILILLSVVALLIAGFCIPFLIQLLRTAKEMATTLHHLNQRLPLIMLNLEEITTNVHRTSVTVNRQVEEISLTLKRIQGIVGVFLGIEEVIRQKMSFPLARTLRTSIAVGKGVRVFVDRLTGGSPEGKGNRL